MWSPVLVTDATLGHFARPVAKRKGLCTGLRGAANVQVGGSAQMAAALAVQDGPDRVASLHSHAVLFNLSIHRVYTV